MDPTYWSGLLADYDAAYRRSFALFSEPGTPDRPTRNALLLACAVAEHETNNSRAWPGSWNFGAVQLRSLTAAEFAEFQAGTLKAGDYLPGHAGVLHVDTHPPGIPYPVWFFAAPDRVSGIAYFLKTLWRLSGGEPDNAAATPATVALEMYRRHYFEGRHVDDRPWVAIRPVPLDAPEQANVDEYAGAVAKCYATIDAAVPDIEVNPPDLGQPSIAAADDRDGTEGGSGGTGV